MENYALIENGTVVNVVRWDGRTEDEDGSPLWAPSDGQQAVPVGDSGAGIGWTHDGAQFVAPPAPPPPPPPPPPASVSRAQAKLALLDAGLLDDVEQAIAGMTGDEFRRASIEWNERATFERQSPFLLQMAAALGLDDAALDALFIDAASR